MAGRSRTGNNFDNFTRDQEGRVGRYPISGAGRAALSSRPRDGRAGVLDARERGSVDRPRTNAEGCGSRDGSDVRCNNTVVVHFDVHCCCREVFSVRRHEPHRQFVCPLFARRDSDSFATCHGLAQEPPCIQVDELAIDDADGGPGVSGADPFHISDSRRRTAWRCVVIPHVNGVVESTMSSQRESMEHPAPRRALDRRDPRMGGEAIPVGEATDVTAVADHRAGEDGAHPEEVGE